MEKEDEKKLLEMVEENHKMLHAMRRRYRLHILFKIVLWGVIFVSLWFGYASLKPYLEGLLDTYESVQGGIQKVQNAGEKVKSVF